MTRRHKTPARKSATRMRTRRSKTTPARPAPMIVNINTATYDELVGLPHVGPVIAERIIAYREKYGRFDEIMGIMEVDGIAAAEYEDLKALIVLD